MKELKYVKTFEFFNVRLKSSIKNEEIFKKYILELKDRGIDFTQKLGKSPLTGEEYTDIFRSLSTIFGKIEENGFKVDVNLLPNFRKNKCDVLIRKITIKYGSWNVERLPKKTLDIDENFVDNLYDILQINRL